jgi:cytoskeletal protein CcmA (bactofilin family)
MIFKTDGKQNDLNGFLDKGSHLQGELHFETTFRVHGKFTGTVTSEGDLIVGEGGELEGEIQVGDLFISGVVRGKVAAKRRIHLAPTGRLYAEVDTPSLVVDEGAFFEGNCTMSRPSSPPPVAREAREPRETPEAIKTKP